MKTTLLRCLAALLLAALFLPACSRMRQTPPSTPIAATAARVTASPFPTPSPTAPPPFPGQEAIASSSVERLELLTQVGTGHIIDIAVSPETQTVAVYTATKIFVYDSLTLEEKGAIDIHYHDSKRKSLAFSPDGKRLAFSLGNEVKLWNLTTWQDENIRVYATVHDVDIVDLAFSPDGRQILLTTIGTSPYCDGHNGHYVLYELDRKLLYDQSFCSDYISYFYHFEDERLYLMISPLMTDILPVNVFVVDLNSGALLTSSECQSTGPDSFDVNIKGAKELLPSKEAVESWVPPRDTDPKESQLSRRCGVEDRNEADQYLEIYTTAEKGLYVITRNWRQFVALELWDLTQCQQEKELAYPSAHTMAFSPAGDLLAASNDYDVYVWDLSTKELRYTLHGTPLQSPLDLMAFSADGKWLVTGTQGQEHYHPENPYREIKISVWDAHQGTPHLRIEPEGEYLKSIVAVSDPNVIRLEDSQGYSYWDLENGQHLRDYAFYDGGTAPAPKKNGAIKLMPPSILYIGGFAAQNQDLLISEAREAYYFWDIESGAFLKEVGAANWDWYRVEALSTDSYHFVVLDNTGVITIFGVPEAQTQASP